MTEENNVVDFLTRKPVENVTTPEGENVQKFMKRWQKTLKDGKFKSVLVVGIDENNFCDYGIICDDPNQLALFVLMLDDVKEFMRDLVFDVSYLDDEE